MNRSEVVQHLHDAAWESLEYFAEKVHEKGHFCNSDDVHDVKALVGMITKMQVMVK